MKRKKPTTGYDKKKINKNKRHRKKSYISSMIISGGKKIPFFERLVKILIYIALRLVIKPKKWKHPKKNYEIIDRTYKRIMSSDFIFIPSSIAFYIIMAFIPLLALITTIWTIDGISAIASIEDVKSVLGKFIPGINTVLEGIENISKRSTNQIIAGSIGIVLSLLASIWIAAGGFAKLVYTQSYIYQHKFLGGYWMNKIKGMVMVVALTIFLFLALLLNIFVNKGIDSWKLSDGLTSFLQYSFLITALLVLVFLGTVALFKLSPRYKIKVRHIVPGAMVTALPTTIFLAFFGGISSILSYGEYGAIGTMLYIGLSSLFVSNFLFMGLISNAAYYKTFVGRSLPLKWTVSNK